MTVEHKRASPASAPPVLVRSLNLPLAVLFGLGVTIGAGIYVLIGATAGRAGMHAPLSFLLAGLVMAPTAASFAEFASRMPVSAGEAAYVRAGFGSERLALLIGLMVICVGVISAAAIAKGSAGYVREFVDLPTSMIITAVVLIMGAVAAWGILQSVAIAGLMTLIEVGGLLVIIFFGATTSPDLITRLPEIWIGLGSFAAVTGVLSASLLAFFAFIGFEGLANIAEEVKDPQRTLPKAIFLTLAISTLFYILIVWIALVSVPRDELAAARAPLSLVFQRVTGASPTAISAIAIVATVNGIIALMVMASRVIYGMADRKMLPSSLARYQPANKNAPKRDRAGCRRRTGSRACLSAGRSCRDDVTSDASHLRVRQCRVGAVEAKVGTGTCGCICCADSSSDCRLLSLHSAPDRRIPWLRYRCHCEMRTMPRPGNPPAHLISGAMVACSNGRLSD